VKNISYSKKVDADQADLWKDKPPLLNKLDVELTERCTLNCLHCCVNLPENDRQVLDRELSTEEIKSILKEAVSLGLLTVRFTGGEPLLREDFEDIYVFARHLGLKVLLFTNATLITPDLVELFSRIPPQELIEITVYGMKKKTYESVTRTPGSFRAARKGIKLLMEKGIPFVVKYALLPQNREDRQAFESWASTIPWMKGSPTYSLFFDLRCRRDDFRKNNLIKNLRPTPQEGVKILFEKSGEFQKELQSFCARFMYPTGDALFSCGAGKGSGNVDPYGFFYPCLLLKHPESGYDLKKGSLQDALLKFFPGIRKLKASNPDYQARCAICFLKGLCQQCPARSWIEHGELDRPVEYHCRIAHLQAIHLGLIKAGENAWEVRDWEKRIQQLTGIDKQDQDKRNNQPKICDM